MKTGLKSCILITVWIFFSLQPRLPKTAQDRKFILKMCLETHLFSKELGYITKLSLSALPY